MTGRQTLAGRVTVPTPDDIRAWPVTVPITTAGRCWGLGRDASYRAARQGTFPVKVTVIGTRTVVARSAIMAALGVPEVTTDAPSNSLADGANGQATALPFDTRSDGGGHPDAA